MAPQSGSRKNQLAIGATKINPILSMKENDENLVRIPRKFLNSLGFIDYDKHGNLPWSYEDTPEIFLSWEYKSVTKYLGIDCEMVGVGRLKVSALGRVSIVNEHGYCIYDTFVNPLKEVTDYRTEFSGIRAVDLEKAPAVDVVLKDVSHLVKGKTLVGHSIHNDLDVLKLCDHPDIRDTALYFKKLLKEKATPSLKNLSKYYLNVDIQSGEHSSIQDAQATIKLYLLHRDQWEHNYSQWRPKANIAAEKMPIIEISDMHVEPRESDLFVDVNSVFVRPNKVIGSYSSCEEYLDIQFRLLLEDFLRPLRGAVRDTQQRKPNPNGAVMNLARITSKAAFEIKGQQRITVKGPRYFEVKGRGFVFVPIERNNLKNWEESGMFIPGSLILLSNNNFKNVKFAEVCASYIKPDEAARGDKDEDCYFLRIPVNFCKEGPSWISSVSDQFSMIESKAYYLSYKYTLEYLQVVDLDTFPMKKYIVDAVTFPSPPICLQNSDEKIDFSVLMKEGSSKKTNPIHPLDLHNWPDVSQLELDTSQYEALQKALTQEFTIIQGPPGTGKTYTSLQIVKMLLTNEWLCQGSPVLLVSYTNHSLDQILELILEFVTNVTFAGDEKKAEKSILRIGGGSKSDKIQPLTLKYKEDKLREKNYFKNMIVTWEKALTSLDGLNFNNNLLEMGILNFLKVPKCILQKMESDPICKLLMGTQMQCQNACRWFGLEEKSLENLKRDNRLFFFKSTNLQNLLSKNLPQIMEMTKNNELKSGDLYVTRWSFYFRLLDRLKFIVAEMKKSLVQWKANFEELKHFETLRIAKKSAQIVGMTTTGAVKYKSMVQDVFKPKIMIAEEAAHVLEAHVIASLTEHCQQMILIGDHKQLRPLTADHNLGENYKLGVSLMERLVQNGVAQNNKNWVQLKCQHRMRPEIARMICPVIYEELENHSEVYKYPAVGGCDKNLFFVDHQNPDEMEKGSRSYFNKYEARFIIDMLTYFINYRRSYKPTQITVIVAYAAQKNLIDNMMKYRPQFQDVRVSTIDGYQGEENDIILLSLVRSNEEKRVGFLKTDNRVCVALSRAKHGLFMIGNMACLKESSNTWKEINAILEETKSIGNRAPLSTQRSKKSDVHPTKPNRKSDHLNTKMTTIIYNSNVKSLENQLAPTPKNQVAPTYKAPSTISKLDPAILNLGPTVSKAVPTTLQFRPTISKLGPTISKAAPTISGKTATMSKTISLPISKSIAPPSLMSGVIQVSNPVTAVKNGVKEGWGNYLCGHTNISAGNQWSALKNVNMTPKCNVMVTRHLSCGHVKSMQYHKFKTPFKCTLKTLTKLSCGHEQKLACDKMATFKCIVSVLKFLPCGHFQMSHCHQSPYSIPCQECRRAKLLQTVFPCDAAMVQSMAKLNISSHRKN